MKRRSFLRTAGTASAAAAAGVFGILKFPRGARAAGWGAWPTDRLDLRLPDDRIASNVLEIQINGGLSPWDTFYTVPDWNDDLRYVHQFSPEAGDFGDPPQLNRDERFAACNNDGEPLWVESGISDGDGVPLFLGPWTVPFRSRPDILSRMRVVVQRHDNVAHDSRASAPRSSATTPRTPRPAAARARPRTRTCSSPARSGSTPRPRPRSGSTPARRGRSASWSPRTRR
jgi:hypothetical protein